VESIHEATKFKATKEISRQTSGISMKGFRLKKPLEPYLSQILFNFFGPPSKDRLSEAI
jgi:hypothetical protein